MSGSYFSNDTIAAISTSLAGDGGVGIIRLSGPAALECSRKICSGLEKPEPRYLHRVEVSDPLTKVVLDDGLAVYFPLGQSFTGEDVVELQMHGGRFLLQNILNLLIGTGDCRLALPGEFSFRAVRNGKSSLAKAEAVAQLIAAKSMFEVKSARKNLNAASVARFEAIQKTILELLAFTELSIDFIDQDVEVISERKMKEGVTSLLSTLETLLQQTEAARRIAQGLLVAIAGEPNAGKSTLFNAILAEERAIVSAMPGTTRDVITEEIQLNPYRVRLADTAGVREGAEAIEREGVQRAVDLLQEAEAVILVLDSTQSLAALERNAVVAQSIPGKTIVALNKSDTVAADNRVEKERWARNKFGNRVFWTSASRSNGVTELMAGLKSVLDLRNGEGLNGFLASEFQLQMIVQCRSELENVRELLEKSQLANPELISASLHSAARALSDLVGETTPDTVLSKIFSEFCIGK